MALTKRNIEKILECGIDSIEFLLDGESAEESEFVRVKSKTHTILSGIRSLINRKNYLINWRFALSRINYAEDRFFGNSKSIETHQWLKIQFNDQVKYK